MFYRIHGGAAHIISKMENPLWKSRQLWSLPKKRQDLKRCNLTHVRHIMKVKSSRYHLLWSLTQVILRLSGDTTSANWSHPRLRLTNSQTQLNFQAHSLLHLTNNNSRTKKTSTPNHNQSPITWEQMILWSNTQSTNLAVWNWIRTPPRVSYLSPDNHFRISNSRIINR